MKERLKGLVVPVLTPFDASGVINEHAFIRHLEFLAHHGVRRIMVNGTTGEFYSLLPKERRMLLKLARRHFSGMVILHACGLGLAERKREVRWANEWGADAVASLPPIYPAGLPAKGIIEYLKVLEAEARTPFILYNFPKHAGNSITPEILKAVPHFALKDSGQDFDLIEHTPRYLVGSSGRVFEAIQQGAAGFISGVANVRPELYTAFEALLAGPRLEEAARMQEEVFAGSVPFRTGGVCALKLALAQKLAGYPVHTRPPLAV